MEISELMFEDLLALQANRKTCSEMVNKWAASEGKSFKGCRSDGSKAFTLLCASANSADPNGGCLSRIRFRKKLLVLAAAEAVSENSQAIMLMLHCANRIAAGRLELESTGHCLYI